MVYLIEIDYTGREKYILDADDKDEAAELAVEKFEDANPGMVVTGTYVETVSAYDIEEMKLSAEGKI